MAIASLNHHDSVPQILCHFVDAHAFRNEVGCKGPAHVVRGGGHTTLPKVAGDHPLEVVAVMLPFSYGLTRRALERQTVTAGLALFQAELS